MGRSGQDETYPNFVVLETFCEGLANGFLMLLLDDSGGGVEDAEGRLALARVVGNAQLEQDSKQLGPRLIYLRGISKEGAMFLGWPPGGGGQILRTNVGVLSGHFGDSIADLVPDQLVGLVDKTLEELLSYNGSLVLGERDEHLGHLVLLVLPGLGGYPAENDGCEGADLCLWGARDVLGQAHEQDLGTRIGPVVGEDLLGLGADLIVGRLQADNELAQLGRDLGGEHRHAGDLPSNSVGFGRRGGGGELRGYRGVGRAGAVELGTDSKQPHEKVSGAGARNASRKAAEWKCAAWSSEGGARGERSIGGGVGGEGGGNGVAMWLLVVGRVRAAPRCSREDVGWGWVWGGPLESSVG